MEHYSYNVLIDGLLHKSLTIRMSNKKDTSLDLRAYQRVVTRKPTSFK